MPINFYRYLVMICLAGLITACGGGSGGGGSGIATGSVTGLGAETGNGNGNGNGAASGSGAGGRSETGVVTGELSNAGTSSEGGTVSSTTTSTGQTDENAEPPAVATVSAPVFCSKAIDTALLTGDATGLTDAAAIARCAREFAKSLATRQAALAKALYDTQSNEYRPGKNAQFVLPISPESAQPFIVGKKGNFHASISVASDGRSAGYGANIFSQFGASENLAHVPVFRRVLSWLLTNDPAKPLPASLALRYTGIDNATVERGFKSAGVVVSTTACNLLADNCGGSQLLVLGSDVKADPALSSRVAQLQASGQPILYVHTATWGGSSSTDASYLLLAGMGLKPGPYAGNFYLEDEVPSGRTADANEAAVAQFNDVLPLLQKITEGGWRTDYAWDSCSNNGCSSNDGLQQELLVPVERLRDGIDSFSLAGRNLFDQPGTTLYRLLVLWADVARQEIRYPMARAANPAALQRAFVADSLIAYVRRKSVAQPDLGTFITGDAARFEVSLADEVLTVPLAEASGFTALGRFAVAGKPVTVQLVDAAGANLSLQVNTQDPKSTRMWDTTYDRPRYLRSPAIPIDAKAATQISSPYGGTLQLVFSNAPAGAKVQLRIRGVARHPFLDLSNGGKVEDFVADFNATAFDWAEVRLPGMELHARVDKMKQGLVDGGYGGKLDTYLRELGTYILDDAYQLAGFALPGKGLPAGILANCAAWGWDCTSSSIHRPPGVQHFNADANARCGYGCSGNPIDTGWEFHPRGWGESHELGHNLQSAWLNVHGSSSSEVSNNMFALHKNWRLLRELEIDVQPDRVGYRTAFNKLVAARSGTDPVASAKSRIWDSQEDPNWNAERMAFYVQWIHYWAARTGDPSRGWEIFTQLYLHARLLAKADWAADRAKLGYGTYADRPAQPSKDNTTDNDNLLIALSKMTERDQRATFDLWGVTYSAAAAAQVASFGFAAEPPIFYANSQRGTNDHAKARRVDMTVPNPVWPF